MIKPNPPEKKECGWCKGTGVGFSGGYYGGEIQEPEPCDMCHGNGYVYPIDAMTDYQKEREEWLFEPLFEVKNAFNKFKKKHPYFSWGTFVQTHPVSIGKILKEALNRFESEEQDEK